MESRPDRKQYVYKQSLRDRMTEVIMGRLSQIAASSEMRASFWHAQGELRKLSHTHRTEIVQ